MKKTLILTGSVVGILAISVLLYVPQGSQERSGMDGVSPKSPEESEQLEAADKPEREPVANTGNVERREGEHINKANWPPTIQEEWQKVFEQGNGQTGGHEDLVQNIQERGNTAFFDDVEEMLNDPGRTEWEKQIMIGLLGETGGEEAVGVLARAIERGTDEELGGRVAKTMQQLLTSCHYT